MRVNMNYAHFRKRLTQLRREFKRLAKNANSDFYEQLTSVYIPQMEADIQEQVPEGVGRLASAINVKSRKLMKSCSVTVTARVNDPNTGYNYAYIQHENEEFSHDKEGAKAHYVEDPFAAMIEDIAAIELSLDYEGVPERDE